LRPLDGGSSGGRQAVKTFPWREFLRAHAAFSGVSDARSLDPLLDDSVSTELILAPGDVIFHQGERGYSVFVIGSGSAEAFLEGRDGTEISLAIMPSGEVFGEMSVLEKRPRSATMRANESSIVLEIDGLKFRHLLDAHPEVELRLLLKMGERLRSTNEKLEGLRFTLDQRVDERTKTLAELNMQLEASNARLQELDRLKSDFVSDVSHELRTPLTSIKGFVDYLLEGQAGELNPVQKDCLARVHGNAVRLTRLINDLLDLARIEAGRVKLHLAPIVPWDVADEVIEEMRPLAAESRVSLIIETPQPGIHVLADRDKLHQILLNLVHNAVKFTPAGGQVRIGVQWSVDGSVVTTVRDTGEGIPAEELPRVFEKFYQLGDEEVEKKGSGLGLTITQKLVELHGGRIWVESEVGAGTTFCFSLPSAQRDA
jgi:signal transduction histidine kinase